MIRSALSLALLLILTPLVHGQPVEPMHTFAAVKKPVTGLAFSPDNKTLAISYADNSLRLMSVSKKNEVGRFDVSAGPNVLRFTTDGRFLLAITNGGIASMDIENKRVKHVFRAETGGGITAFDLSPDGKVLAGVGKSSLSTWNFETGVNLATIDAHSGNAVNAVVFSREGDLIWTAGNDRKLIGWSVNTAQPQKEYDLTFRGLSLAIAPSGDRLIVLGDDRTVSSVDLSNGEVSKISMLEAPATGIAVAPDREIAVISGTGTQPGVLLIDKKKTPAAKLAGHQSKVLVVTISRDGRFIASGDQNGVVNVYATMDVER